MNIYIYILSNMVIFHSKCEITTGYTLAQSGWNKNGMNKNGHV